jgi:hypothetical protein
MLDKNFHKKKGIQENLVFNTKRKPEIINKRKKIQLTY